MTKTTEKRLVQMPAVEHIKSIKQKLREAKSKYLFTGMVIVS